MEIVEKEYGGVHVLVLKGEFDAESLSLLDTLIETITARRGNTVLLDFKDVPIVTSDALDQLLRLRGVLAGHGGALRIVQAPPAVQRIVELARLARRLPLDAGYEEALKAVQGREKEEPPLQLGDFLVRRGAVPAETMREILDEQKRLRLKKEGAHKLGVLLIEKGALPRQELQKHLLEFWRAKLGAGRAGGSP